jgi:hypothetical protein
MPNQRSKGQKLVPIPMTEAFIKALDRAYRAAGYDDRSKFIRAAIREKLVSMGLPIEEEETLAPSRSGKIAKYPGRSIEHSPYLVNDSLSSNAPSGLIGKAPRALKTALREAQASPPSPGAGGTSGNKPVPKRGTGRK